MIRPSKIQPHKCAFSLGPRLWLGNPHPITRLINHGQSTAPSIQEHISRDRITGSHKLALRTGFRGCGPGPNSVEVKDLRRPRQPEPRSTMRDGSAEAARVRQRPGGGDRERGERASGMDRDNPRSGRGRFAIRSSAPVAKGKLLSLSLIARCRNDSLTSRPRSPHFFIIFIRRVPATTHRPNSIRCGVQLVPQSATSPNRERTAAV